jgi:hypothetical protein
MARSVPRPFTRWDVAIVAASALLGAAMACVTDLEYLASHGASTARMSGFRRLPGWIGDRRHDAIRVNHDGAALLSGLSLGLAAATFRPRRGDRNPGRRRLAPGHVASAVSATTVLAIALHQWAAMGFLPGWGARPPSAFPGVVPAIGFYSLWQNWRPVITWAVLGAWSGLIVAGRWGRPVDMADRLGRWLGYGWLALIAVQGAVYVIAWF